MAEYAKVRKVKISLVKKITPFVHDQTISLSFNDVIWVYSLFYALLIFRSEVCVCGGGIGGGGLPSWL